MLRSDVEQRTVTIPTVLVLAGLVGLTLAVEHSFAVSLRLPGHRAFPGALTLLVAAQSLAPALLLPFAAAVAGLLLVTGAGGPLVPALWLVAAGGVLLSQRFWRPGTVVGCLVAGLGFGLLRYVSVSFGVHHTPEFVRLGSHLAFGGIGGLVAAAAGRLTRRRDAA